MLTIDQSQQTWQQSILRSMIKDHKTFRVKPGRVKLLIVLATKQLFHEPEHSEN